MKVFITGVSSGIGRELALLLLDQGHHVWGVARNKPDLDSLSKQVDNAKLTTEICDVSSPGDIERVLGLMRDHDFVPDIVVLNAGANIRDSQPGFSMQHFHQNLAVNLEGAIAWVEAFLPVFEKRKRGTFVAISSMAAYRPGYMSVGYSASKAALSNAMRGLDVNFGNRRIKFITIHFGPIKTALWPGRPLVGMPSAKQAARFITSRFKKRSGFHYYPLGFVILTWFGGRLPVAWLRKVFRIWKKDL